jgi:hypothetical protein
LLLQDNTVSPPNTPRSTHAFRSGYMAVDKQDSVMWPFIVRWLGVGSVGGEGELFPGLDDPMTLKRHRKSGCTGRQRPISNASV